MARRKVCVVVNSRANYGRIKSFLSAAQKHSDLDLQIIVGASALLYRFGAVVDIMRTDGFEPNSVVHTIVEGETPTTMAKSTGLAVIELATHFENLKPDVVLTVADRFETLATAVAACYMNIPVAHTQGGEITGSIDENVRHAVTKLSHIHFPATERAQKFLTLMGEDPESIHLTGCPSIDLLLDIRPKPPNGVFRLHKGVGPPLDSSKPYILVLQHPVTTEYGDGLRQINETLKAVDNIGRKGMQVVWLWPNIDAGSDDVAKGLRMFRESKQPNYVHFYRNFTPEDYAWLLNSARCIVGNSSSGLREGAYLGVPCVNIGSRQYGRERTDNVVDVPYNADVIETATNRQVNHERYPSSMIYGNGQAGELIAQILVNTEIKLKKTLSYFQNI